MTDSRAGLTVPSSVALSLISGSAPYYNIVAGTNGIEADRYGVVRMGPNVLGPTGHPSTWDTQKNVCDFMWDPSTLRVRARTAYFTEQGDPAEVVLGRFGPDDSYPNHTGDVNDLQGLNQSTTIGAYGWSPAVAPFGGTYTTPGAKTYGRSADIIARTAEVPRVTAADGSTKAMGTHVVLTTAPIGSDARQERMAWTSEGVVGTLGSGFDFFDLHSLGLSRGDLYSRGKTIANGGIGVGNAAAATTLGSVVKKMQVFTAAGVSQGYVAIYDAIT